MVLLDAIGSQVDVRNLSFYKREMIAISKLFSLTRMHAGRTVIVLEIRSVAVSTSEFEK